METRPTPSGWQHYRDVLLRHAPDSRFTDPARALADLEDGLEQPLVEIVEQQMDGAVLVRVGVFGGHCEPSAEDVAAIEGVVAELRFSVRSR